MAAALAVAGLAAQAKPNFAGKWTLVPDAGAAAGGGMGARGGGRGGGMGAGALSGPEMTIAQDAATLKVDRAQGQNQFSYTFKLDGSESKNSVPGRMGGAPSEVVSKAVWDGNKLTITSTQSMMMQEQQMTIETKQVLSLDADGMLVVETTRSGMRGGQAMTTTAKYKKS